MLTLTQPSYVDPSALIERELKTCSRAYVGRDVDGKLLCFYLTEWHELEIDGKRTPAVYLGLSATTQQTKNTGLVAALYAEALKEITEEQERRSTLYLLWSTTASPTIFLAMSIFLEQVEPSVAGAFSESGLKAVAAIRRYRKLSPIRAGEHPFVLRGVAERTLYSSDEILRIEKIKKRKSFTLFDDINVHEAMSDRLLVVARTPKKTVGSKGAR